MTLPLKAFVASLRLLVRPTSCRTIRTFAVQQTLPRK